MDAVTNARKGKPPIECVNMHTTGEPTRIIISGHPDLNGTLLEQRAEAKAKYDHLRKRVILEPAGHADMYGALLRKETELTMSGEAHIGVLFLTNDGYSTMCGHATIALGRFLVDTQDLSVFPRRNEVQHDPQSKTSVINLHAPCGLVRITVPVTEDGDRSDQSRPVTFVNVPSFATGKDIKVDIPEADRWPELGQRGHVAVSFCYGGAFTCLVMVEELGFDNLKQPIDLPALNLATRNLKSVVNRDPHFQKYMTHPQHDDLSSLYTIIVVDKSLGKKIGDSKGVETGLCYFGNQQIDRSPTGSAVAARIAYAFATGDLALGESWSYHSLVSNASNGQGGFVGTVLEQIPELYDRETMLAEPVRVRVGGYAFYIGSSSYISEDEDPFGSGGFLFNSFYCSV
jgi:trans-L-3-hydroxyproline dehydratase